MKNISAIIVIALFLTQTLALLLSRQVIPAQIQTCRRSDRKNFATSVKPIKMTALGNSKVNNRVSAEAAAHEEELVTPPV